METTVVLCSVPELDINHNHTYTFNTKQAQLDFFNSRKTLVFNEVMYQKDNDSIKLDIVYGNSKLMSSNYLYFRNPDDNVIHYCFIVNKKYINENTTQLFLKLDVMQTYLVGIDYHLSDSFIERQHMNEMKSNGKPDLDVLNRPEDIEVGEYVVGNTINIYDFEQSGGYIVASTDKLSKKKARPQGSGGSSGGSSGGGGSNPGGDTLRNKIVESARKLIGKPYILGGNYPPLGSDAGTDCSGLCQWAYHDNGISITRTTYTQIGEGIEVNQSDLKPGDLIFSYFSSPGVPEHVFMFSKHGNDGSLWCVEAQQPGVNILERQFTWSSEMVARRIISNSGGSSSGSSNVGSINAQMDQWDSLIIEKANKYSTEPAIIKAIMYQESGGDPNAVSPVGASGLLQLMPATAQEVAGKLGWSSYDVFNPDQNVEMGTFYFTDLTSTYGLQGPTTEATYANTLAAYNWGIGNFLSSGERSNVESGNYSGLPGETRQYITNILSTYNRIK